jgi:hypothetical protein
MGRWPTTSPVTRKAAPNCSIYSLAFFNVKIRQSMQGFIPAPLPCLGFRMISMYSCPFDTVLIGIFILSATTRAWE